MQSILRVCVSVAVLGAAGFAGSDDQADTLIRQGHWKRVRAIAQAQLKASPSDAYANYLTGAVYFKWGQLDSALSLRTTSPPISCCAMERTCRARSDTSANT